MKPRILNSELFYSNGSQKRGLLYADEVFIIKSSEWMSGRQLNRLLLVSIVRSLYNRFPNIMWLKKYYERAVNWL